MSAVSKKTIAVFEPHTTLRNLYELELQEEGYATVPVGAGSELVELLLAGVVDLVVSSYEAWTAPELTRLLEIQRLINIPLIINSGYAAGRIAVPLNDTVAFVLKSSDLHMLKKTIRSLLDHSCSAPHREQAAVLAPSVPAQRAPAVRPLAAL